MPKTKSLYLAWFKKKKNFNYKQMEFSWLKIQWRMYSISIKYPIDKEDLIYELLIIKMYSI